MSTFELIRRTGPTPASTIARIGLARGTEDKDGCIVLSHNCLNFDEFNACIDSLQGELEQLRTQARLQFEEWQRTSGHNE